MLTPFVANPPMALYMRPGCSSLQRSKCHERARQAAESAGSRDSTTSESCCWLVLHCVVDGNQSISSAAMGGAIAAAVGSSLAATNAAAAAVSA